MKTPSAGTPISPLTLLRGFLPIGGTETLQRAIQKQLNVTWCGLSGSGTSGVFATLKALRKHSDKTEVILPAYTAPSLILPIRKAGLTPILCDISPDTLNSGSNEILPCVGQNTLAIMPVHMFGLPTDVPEMNRQLSNENVFTIEDAASAMGAEIDNVPVATQSDIGVFSFNRGKNLSTFTGGAVLSNREDLIKDIDTEIKAFAQPNFKYALKIRTFSVALSMVVHPLGYSLLLPLASKFKYTSLHTDFHTWAYTHYQARLGLQLIKKLEQFTNQRAGNAQYLIQALTDIEGVKLPQLLPNSRPAYNQFPILLPDETTRQTVHQAILKTGLEATLLYPDPIHRLYPDIWDGQGRDPFPNATTVAKRILLLPVHPLVPQGALERAVEAIAKTLKKI
ncbi:MAG: perosamine synthetase [Candidatus Latescibacterota bacterium]|jgi:perosamine synthetase